MNKQQNKVNKPTRCLDKQLFNGDVTRRLTAGIFIRRHSSSFIFPSDANTCRIRNVLIHSFTRNLQFANYHAALTRRPH